MGRVRNPAGIADTAIAEWRPGDLAECLGDGTWCRRCRFAEGPTFGEVRIVTEVHAGRDSKGKPALYLGFGRYAPRTFNAIAFRRITPRADETIAADAAFLQQLIARPAGARP